MMFDRNKLRQQRIDAGLCRDCGKQPPMQDKVVCDECSGKRSRQDKKLRKSRKQAGICTQCKTPVEGKMLCRACTLQSIETYKKRRRENKAFVIAFFGGKCIECGESDLIVLTLDHIDNDGHIDKKTENGKKQGSPAWYAKLVKLIKQGKPLPRRLQVLCFNDHARKDLSWEY